MWRKEPRWPRIKMGNRIIMDLKDIRDEGINLIYLVRKGQLRG